MIHEEQKRTEFDGRFSKRFELLIEDVLDVFAKPRKSVEKMFHKKI